MLNPEDFGDQYTKEEETYIKRLQESSDKIKDSIKQTLDKIGNEKQISPEEAFDFLDEIDQKIETDMEIKNDAELKPSTITPYTVQMGLFELNQQKAHVLKDHFDVINKLSKDDKFDSKNELNTFDAKWILINIFNLKLVEVNKALGNIAFSEKATSTDKAKFFKELLKKEALEGVISDFKVNDIADMLHTLKDKSFSSLKSEFMANDQAKISTGRIVNILELLFPYKYTNNNELTEIVSYVLLINNLVLEQSKYLSTISCNVCGSSQISHQKSNGISVNYCEYCEAATSLIKSA